MLIYPLQRESESGRPTRNVRRPEQYNPNTGQSYHQKKLEQVHNIKKEIFDPLEVLEYSSGEEKIVATILTQLKEKCNGQQFTLKRGLKEFSMKGKMRLRVEKQSTYYSLPCQRRNVIPR